MNWDRSAELRERTPEGQRTFQYQWLQRFNTEGQRVGVPLDFNAVLPEGLQHRNWGGAEMV